jgi:hypothetical protein
MSCILYNLAIEPLACTLRKSKKLKGYSTKGIKKIIAKLFADDAIIYLGIKDSYKSVMKTVHLFKIASTAVFNLDKMEALPIGSEDFRKKVIETRIVGKERLPDHVKIKKDREPMRTLGSWVGNQISIEDTWIEITKKHKEIMDTWAKSHPTLRGKELILKALVTSRSWFLATVNRMPEHIEKEMTQNIKNFLWDGRERGLMELKATTAKREEGGLGIPDIKARLAAIHIM